jgi:hypothetical protein
MGRLYGRGNIADELLIDKQLIVFTKNKKGKYKNIRD